MIAHYQYGGNISHYQYGGARTWCGLLAFRISGAVSMTGEGEYAFRFTGDARDHQVCDQCDQRSTYLVAPHEPFRTARIKVTKGNNMYVVLARNGTDIVSETASDFPEAVEIANHWVCGTKTLSLA